MAQLVLAWMSAFAVALLIFVLSSRSQLPTPNVIGFDKLAHFAAFGLLALMLARALDLSRVRLARAALLGAVLSTLYGASDELHQMFVPGRSPDVLDLVADAIGAAAGAWLWTRLRSARSPSA